MMYYFNDLNVRLAAEDSKVGVELAFKSLCENERFRSSIEGTTKTIESIYTRIRLWGEVLQHYNVPATLPQLINNKIIRGD